MSSTVTMGGFEHESTTDSADEMVKALNPKDEDNDKPKVVEDQGKKVEVQKDPAAQELGRKGGEASAKAREAQKVVDEQEKRAEEKMAREAKASDDMPAEKEKKPEEKPPEKEKQEHPRDSARARVEQVTRQLSEERKRNQALEERIAKLEQSTRPAEKTPAPESGSQTTKGLPDPDNYATHEEWVAAVAKHTAQELLDEERKGQTLKAREQALLGAVESFQKRFKEAVGEDRDSAEELVGFIESMPHPTFMVPPDQQTAATDLSEYICRAENPVDWIKYLQAHPDEHDRLVKSENPGVLYRGLGRIEAKLEAQANGVPERRYTPPPPPLTPLRAGANPPEADITKINDFDEFMARSKRR